MDFDDYRLGDRARYASLVDSIRQILSAAVKAESMSPHAITGRAKDPDSLAKKLAERSIDPASALEEQIKDLAGARVVFLTNAQVQRFLGSGIIHENFDVISVNVHHRVPGTENETRLFSSTNYFVQLKEARLSLPEYAPFAGMKAEIQIQTLLNHAWAEMNHDAFYKEPAFRHVDCPQFERIKERMDAVMREHLLPAGHDFDKISRDMALLLEAEESYEPVVESIRSSASNDELGAAIETLDETVMPRLAKRCDRFLALLDDLVDAVGRTRGAPAARIETMLGPLDGDTGLDVARKFAQLLPRPPLLRSRADAGDAFLPSRRRGHRRRADLWVEEGKRFAEHDLDVWRTHGPAIQRIVVDGIAALAPEAAANAQGLILGMLEKVLSCEVGGTSRGAELNTLVIHQGTVAPSPTLGQIRAGAMSLLEGMLAGAASDGERGAILHSLREATRPPFHGGNAALRATVMGDAARVIAIERAAESACGLELRRQMEAAALHVHHWYSAVPPDMAEDAALVAAQRSVIAELHSLRDQLNADEDFRIYKTLIGYDSVRPQAWTADPFDFRATDAWRLAVDGNIFALIDAEGVDAWTRRVRRYLAEPISPGDTRPMAGFSTRLARSRSEIAVHLLEQMDDELTPLLLPLLIGLGQVGHADTIGRFAHAWIVQGRFLELLADWLGSQTVADPVMLASVTARACALGESSGGARLGERGGPALASAADRRLVEDVFMPAVEHFAAIGDPLWMRQAWEVRQGGLVPALDPDQSRRLLGSFADVPEIDYDAERILSLVAGQRPELVLDFFEGRIRRERDRDAARFNPIPFRLHDLQVPLAHDPALLLSAVRRWYDLDPRLHQFRGGRLVGNVFPKLPAAIADPLASLVRNGNRDDLAFVLDTLGTYGGIEAVYPLCMDVVDRLEPGDELERMVSTVLGGTGVVTGEFGHVEADAMQHALLGGYLEDPRPNVRAFAERTRTASCSRWPGSSAGSNKTSSRCGAIGDDRGC
jgi:ppGpp synthetase/RelA/SpoT-type nucleotidyltranferase